MSFIRLLAMNGAVDRSGEPHRYRKVPRNPFPDFRPGRSVAGPVVNGKQNEQQIMTTPPLFNEQEPAGTQNAETEMRVLSVGVQPPRLNRLPPVETFFMRLKRLFRREQKPAPVPVQTEWPMDRIVVVRNDLSDAEFEVVWAENTNPPEEAKPRGERLVGRAWKKVNPFQKPEPAEVRS